MMKHIVFAWVVCAISNGAFAQQPTVVPSPPAASSPGDLRIPPACDANDKDIACRFLSMPFVPGGPTGGLKDRGSMVPPGDGLTTKSGGAGIGGVYKIEGQGDFRKSFVMPKTWSDRNAVSGGPAATQ
jgi:hypothetical protein